MRHGSHSVQHGAKVFGERLECKDCITTEIYNRFKEINMSTKRQVVDVVPSNYGNDSEGAILSGFECPRCCGMGFTVDYGARRGEESRLTCERCGGSGRLRALVRIAWEPDK
jgi:DnaJ-class molecular chaperone